MGTSREAEIVNDALSDPVPEIDPASNNVVKLMLGVKGEVDGETVWHTDAEVRELNGADEEYLASIQGKKGITYSEYMSAILSRAVLRIGTISVSRDRSIVEKLILGDRDLLYLAIMKATYGPTRELRMNCSSCGKSNDIELDVDEDFPVTLPDFDVRSGLFVDTLYHGTLNLRLPTGEDTVIAQKKSKNDAELNTAMLARCVVWDEGEAPADPYAWAKSLGVADRRSLVSAVLAVEIGPKMGEVNTQCASCGSDMPILLDWVSLLLG